MAAKETRPPSAALAQLSDHLWAVWGDKLSANGIGRRDLDLVVSARGAEALSWAEGRQSWEWLCLLLAADLAARRP